MQINEPKIVTLPSGATLRIGLSAFADAKALYQTMMRELRLSSMKEGLDIAEFLKDAFCIGFSSPTIEAALNRCMLQCTIDYGAGPERITPTTFEPEDNRGDYIKVCMEVAKANMLPFGKSLFADFKAAMALMNGVSPKPSSTTTTSSSTSGSANPASQVQ